VTIVVTVTYVLLVMRADNDGEGGIMALITLIRRKQAPGHPRTKLILAGLGLFGAALFLGDSMITPAISVLSAVEGLKVASPSLGHLVVPITAAIILGSRLRLFERLHWSVRPPRLARSPWRRSSHAVSPVSRESNCPGPATRVGRFGTRVLTASLVERRRRRGRPRDRVRALRSSRDGDRDGSVHADAQAAAEDAFTAARVRRE